MTTDQVPATMNPPDVLVVIPVHNGERFLSETLESVLAQTFGGWRLAIVDDGSTDSSREIAQSFVRRDSRVILVSQAQAGVGEARNRGGQQYPETEFLIFLDQDDLWKPNALEGLVSLAQANPKAPAVHGLLALIGEDGLPLDGAESAEDAHRRRAGIFEDLHQDLPDNLPTTFGSLAVANFIYTPGIVLIRRTDFEAIGGFDQSMAPADDWDLWLRLAARGDVPRIAEVVLSWRRHPGQASVDSVSLREKAHRVHKKAIRSELSRAKRAEAVNGFLQLLIHDRKLVAEEMAGKTREREVRRLDRLTAALSKRLLVLLANYDVSVVITAHGEGRLAHRTVLSAIRTIERARADGLFVELVAILDAPSRETVAYFGEHRMLFDEVLRVDCRDLALARNWGARTARGQYVAFLDADDLFGENWIAGAYSLVKAREHEACALHPSCSLYFGQGHRTFWHPNSTDPGFRRLDNIQANFWTAMCFAPRRLLLDVPYGESSVGSGFGYEDWHWNSETLALGVPHLAVPETAHFVRLKGAGSLNAAHGSHRALIRRSRFFSRELIQEAAVAQFGKGFAIGGDEKVRSVQTVDPKDLERGLGFAYKAARWVYRRTIRRLIPKPAAVSLMVNRVRARLDILLRRGRQRPVPTGVSDPRTPMWLLEEWTKLNAIEPDLNPIRDRPKLQHYRVPESTIAAPFVLIQRRWPEGTSHLFLLADSPGDDAMRCIEAVARPGANQILCIFTGIPSAVPEGVACIDFNQFGSDLSDEDRALLLATLIVQMPPQTAHIDNCRLGADMLAYYGRALSFASRIFVSGFSRAPDPNGMLSPGFDALDRAFGVIDGVICAAKSQADSLIETYDFDSSKFYVLDRSADCGLESVPGYFGEDAPVACEHHS